MKSKIIMVALLSMLTFSVFAQKDTSSNPKTHKHTPGKLTYTCPMHPQIVMDKPGKCSICGMDLLKSKQKKLKIYACPMHSDVTSKEPGNCTKCGMEMTKHK